MGIGAFTTTRALRGTGSERRGKGRRLSPGATVAILASGSTDCTATVAWLEGEGYGVALEGRGGTPGERARAVEDAFADPEIGAILCGGGRSSAAEFVRDLDYELIAANPKPLVGSGDVTVIHSALARACGLVTFWGPLAEELGTADAIARRGLLQALTGFEPLGRADSGGIVETIVSGIAEGELVGGDVAALSFLMGTVWELDTRGKILLLAAPRREPWRIDRFLLHLTNAGKLQECAGICLVGLGGDGAAVEAAESIVEPLGIPAVRGLPMAPGSRFLTVPLGARVRLDAYDRCLEVLEAGVH